MKLSSQRAVVLSPFLILSVNIITAFTFGKLIAKWAFAPVILTEWGLFVYFIIKYRDKASVISWLGKADKNYGWHFACLSIGFLPLPIFLKYNHLLNDWTIWFPWLMLALINPWLEEFYWRGLLLDATKKWHPAFSILFSSLLFSLNHFVFGINSELFRGTEIFVSTLIMGIVWAVAYKKTGTLRWAIVSHMLVDLLNLSIPSFLDFYKPSW